MDVCYLNLKLQNKIKNCNFDFVFGNVILRTNLFLTVGQSKSKSTVIKQLNINNKSMSFKIK